MWGGEPLKLATPLVKVPVKRIWPCRHGEQIVSHCVFGHAANHVRMCDLDHGDNGRVTLSGFCTRCDDYWPEGVPQPVNAKVGVAVGCYGWPRLAETQVNLIRQHNGPMPILLCDDGSPHTAAFDDLERRYPDVTHWPNPERKGHYAGDLSVFSKAVQWGKTTGLDYVVKVSQRMLVDRPGWIGQAVETLAPTGYATLAAPCVDGRVDLHIRSELVMMEVRRWCAGEPLRRMSLDRLGHGRPTELAVNHIARVTLGGAYPWPGLPRNRYQRTDGYVWHCSHKREEYAAVALRFGLTLDDGFHVNGADKSGDWLAG